MRYSNCLLVQFLCVIFPKAKKSRVHIYKKKKREESLKIIPLIYFIVNEEKEHSKFFWVDTMYH